RTWQRRHRNLRLAVNLSAPEMLRHDLAEQIQAVLDDTGFPPRLLQVEVPESHVMQDVPRAEKALRRLKDLGVSVMLDRFGIGYASLSRPAQLPADGVKLDLAFQRKATTHPDDASLLTAVVAVARSLKLRVAAQGVETEAQMELLRGLGCDEVQGYLLSPPVPVAGCEALLAGRPAATASPPREGRGGARRTTPGASTTRTSPPSSRAWPAAARRESSRSRGATAMRSWPSGTARSSTQPAAGCGRASATSWCCAASSARRTCCWRSSARTRPRSRH